VDEDAPARNELRTFLIADVRGYTTYTREHGDEAAGALAGRFAEVVDDVAGAHDGFLLELRGDEALVVFVSARQALRAAVAMQDRFQEVGLPRGVGIGLDAGEAVAIQGGYRGGSLNLAARLCSQAKAGEVLASEAVIHLAAKVDGLAYVAARTLKLKGYDHPVRAVDVVPADRVPRAISIRMQRASSRLRADRRIQAAVAAVACVAVVAVLLPGLLDRAQPSPGVTPGLVFLDQATGEVVGHIAMSNPGAAFFADGRFWVRDPDSSVMLVVDPTSHRVTARIPVPAGWGAVEGNHLWVASYIQPTLTEIDIPSERTIHEYDLSQGRDDTGGLSYPLIVDDGLWVQHGSDLLEVDLANGHVRGRVRNVNWGSLTQAEDGSLWSASWPGLVQILPSSYEHGLVFDRGAEFGSVVSEGGSLWTGDEAKGVVYKVDDRDAQLIDTYVSGEGARYLASGDGQVWVANQDDGSITKIDAITGEQRTFELGHPVIQVTVGAGQVLVQVLPGKTFEDEIAALEGDVARVLVPGYAYMELDPAIAQYAGNALQQQLADATCARLLRAPDDPRTKGWEYEPELAAGPPSVTDDGRTYTFTVAPGSSFAPPSNEPITADTYAFSIERALSPVFGDAAQGAWMIDDIEGEAAYRAGEAEHISGIRVDGDELSITLTEPSPTFLARLAFPSFCPVPLDTAIVRGGVGDPTAAGVHVPLIPSSGSFAVTYHLNGELTILEPNPNYAGPRSASLDAVALREGVDPAAAIGRVESGSWDLAVVSDPSMDPGGVLDAAWGSESDAAKDGDQRYYAPGGPGTASIALNAGRPLFADARVRRAVSLAVSRRDLADEVGWLEEADGLLPESFPGGGDTRSFDPDGDPGAAVQAMGDAPGGAAVMAYASDCAECPRIATDLKEQLAALGIEIRPRAFGDVDAKLYSGHAPFDMVLRLSWADYLDGPTFLSTMLGGDIPADWLPGGVGNAVARLQDLEGEARIEETSALAERLTRSMVPAVTYGQVTMPSFFSPRLGCRVFPPLGYGADLTSLCVEGG
jgi:class 3 adenylate cyclase/ABC-type transport system substrate-binding protein